MFNVAPGAVMTRTQRQVRWGGSTQGGIQPSSSSPNVFLYSDPSEGEKYGYNFDGWAADEEVYLYTGEGRSGRQEIRQGNAAILRHREDHRALRLWVAITGKQPGGKLHRYVGEFAVDPDQPYIREDVRGADSAMRSVVVFRLVPAGAVEHLEADNSRGDIAVHGPLAELVAAEVSAIHETDVKANSGGTATRREAALSDEYEAYLTRTGHQVLRWKLRLPGEAAALYSDLYDVDANELYEVKASSDRMSVRLAVGQLLDYRRHVARPNPRLTVLLPGPPSPDLLDLLHSCGIGCVYPIDGGEFKRLDARSGFSGGPKWTGTPGE
jgi:5-methylcytosine-specific restriction protein A